MRFRAAGSREVREEGLIEFEVDSRQVVDIGVSDAVDAPNARGDERGL